MLVILSMHNKKVFLHLFLYFTVQDDESAKKVVKKPESDEEYKETVTESPFWYLSLDTPAAPLFKVSVKPV